MTSVKNAFAMLAAGGAALTASQAEAAIQVVNLNIAGTSDPWVDIKLAGSSAAQFHYGAYATTDGVVKAQLTATSLGGINTVAFSTGALPTAGEDFSGSSVWTANITDGVVKNANNAGEAYYHLMFEANGEDYLGTARIGSDFSLKSITYDDKRLTGAIPEPSSWALLILGFGATGAAIRRRRRAQPLAAMA